MVYALDIQQKFAPAKIDNISKLLNIALPLVSAFAAIVFLVMALYGAYIYLTSAGNPEGLKKASSIFVYTGIGLIIVIASFVIVQLIGKMLGIPKII